MEQDKFPTAILDFMAFMCNFKNASSNAVKMCTYIYIYEEVFLDLLKNTFLIIFCEKHSKIREHFRFC